MSTTSNYSFQLHRHSYKGQETYRVQDLIYEEPGHKLVVYLEISGVPQFDLIGWDTEFHKWTEPAGEPIPAEKQTEILRRLAEWSRKQSLRIDIGPGIDMNTYFAEQEKKGFKVERRPDGTVVVSHPKRKI